VTDEEVSELIMAALGQASHGEPEQAATTLYTIGINSDGYRMYGVCCSIAAAGTHVLKKLYGEAAKQAEGWAMAVQDPATPVHRLFALRFLTSYTNGDTDTCLALYNAAIHASDEEYADSVSALLVLVASLIRLALDEKDAGRLPG
jgi:hypothetical protein